MYTMHHAATNDGWGNYPDAREELTMSGLGEVGPSPATSGYPTSGDPRQKPVNNPTQVRVDAAMLRKLDYPAPDTGNAYDPAFMAAVRAFQIRTGLTADGLIGPTTRAQLVEIVSTLGASGGGGGGGGGGALVLPPDENGGELLNRTSTGGKDNTMTYVGLGVGALVVAGLAWYALK